MKTMKFRIGDIQPNPFRAIDRYPLRSDKINALRESIRATKLWTNIVARIREDGLPELAYGHHRLEAARLEFGPDRKIILIIETLDDGTMLQMMIRDNQETYGSSALVEQENIRAVVEAYAAGTIELKKRGGGHSQHRFAPSVYRGETTNSNRRSPYSAAALSEYLGWKGSKAEDTLHALELIEKDILSESEYEGLKSNHARVITTEIRRVTNTLEDRIRRFEADAKDALDSGDEALHELALQESQHAQKDMKRVKFFVNLTNKKLLEGTWSAKQIPRETEKYFGLDKSKLPEVETEEETDPVVQMFLEDLHDFHNSLIEIRQELGKFPVGELDFAALQFKTLQKELADTDLEFTRVLKKFQDKGRGGLLEYIR